MPFATNKDLPDRIKEKFSAKQQSQWREVFNSVFADTQDEGKAFAAANSVVSKEVKIIQKNDSQRFTLGIVYEPDVEDSQGDFAEAPEIEKACWNFARKLQGNKKATDFVGKMFEALEGGPTKIDATEIYDEIEKGGLNDSHVNTPLDDGLGDIVENYIAPCDFEINGEQVLKGSWLMGIIWSPEYFEKIELGERNGLSMEGRGRRIDQENS